MKQTDVMRRKYGGYDYFISQKQTPGGLTRANTSLIFYSRLLCGPVQWLCRLASRGKCDDIAWVNGSVWCGDILEGVGGQIEISGREQFKDCVGPFVIIANHMSTLETFLLPSILRPNFTVTFVVKKSLTTMPFFGPVMRSRDPVAVGRQNPREDLTTVLEEGPKRLAKGVSIVVFPQSTRSLHFSREHFNSIGVKLARRAKVPVIPLVLKTDAWGQGRKIKELGKIRPDLPARFKFGRPITIDGNGKKEHDEISTFIETNLKAWQEKDGINQ